VTFADRAIAATGQHNITLTLPDQYLREETIDAAGEVVRREVSEQRISGGVTREVKLQPGWIYSAEPREFRERAVGFWEKTSKTIGDLYDAWFGGKKPYQPADILYLYDPKAEAGAKNDQESLKAPFVALNVPIEEQPAAEARRFANEDHNLLLVPYNAAELLSETQIAGIKQYVERGGQLVTDFRNPLAKALGVRFFETTTLVERVRDKLFPEESLRWKSGEVMYKFETHDSDLVLAAEEESNLSVAIARRIGQGRLIFFGTRFDPVSNGGFSRYPFLAQYVERICSLTPMLRREQVEVYFDPGYRHTVSIEVLAERWNQAGVRVLHVGGWHEYPRYTYDYERLIKRCHAAGILVYLWLEPPQVSQKLWMEHPEWREKNYKGEDVRASWRYPVALTEPACLAAVIAHYRKLLARYDWDGVNLAELYFEAGRGMKDPQLMTPMHPSARREFERRHGFDPALLFDANSSAYWPEDPAGLAAFVKYRVDKITEFHAAFLRLTDEFARQRPGFDVVVTVLDNLAAPELRAYIGIDTREIAALRKNHKFTLLVEDPESMWSLDPRRYEGIAARYQGLIDEADLALDLNILSFRAPKAITPFPTRVQTGAECAWLVNSAARGARRVVIYSESSVNPQDIMFLPAAYSAPARIDADENGWIIDTPHTLVLQLGSETDEVLMDGRTQKSIGAGRFLMTVGRHTVQAAGGGLNPLEMEMQASRLLSITGELLSLNSSRRSVKLTYRSAGRCLVTLAATPIAVFIDERETPFTVIAGNGRAGLFLPPGEHSALIITESRLSYGIDLTSFYSTNLIVLFGGLSVGLLIALYITVRVRSLASRSKP
jgi:hypothetical protein